MVLRRIALVVGSLALALLPALPGVGDEVRADPGQPVAVPESGEITVVGKEFRFTPNAIRVEKGQEVTIVFKNEGKISHSLAIPELGLKTETIQNGTQATLRFTAKQTGTYPFWCTVPGHKQAGMIGKVVVAK